MPGIPTVTGPIGPHLKDFIKQMVQSGRSAKEIAKHLGFSHQFILQAVKEAQQEEAMSESAMMVRLPDPWELPASLAAPGMLGPCQCKTVQLIDPTEPGWLQFKGNALFLGKDNKLFLNDYILYRTQASQSGESPYQVKIVIGRVREPSSANPNPIEVIHITSGETAYNEARMVLTQLWGSFKSPRLVALEAAAELAVKSVVDKSAGIPVLNGQVHDEVVVDVVVDDPVPGLSLEETKKILQNFEKSYPDVAAFKKPGPKAKDAVMPVPKVFTGVLFTQSGKLTGMTRSEFMTIVGNKGGTFTPEPTPACNVLVMGSGNVSFNKPSGKIKSALKYGIPIISQNTFDQMAKGGKIKSSEVLNDKFQGVKLKTANVTVIAQFFEDSSLPATTGVVKKKKSKQAVFLKEKMVEMTNLNPALQDVINKKISKEELKDALLEKKLNQKAAPVIKKKKKVSVERNDEGLSTDAQELLDKLLKLPYEERMLIASKVMNHKETT